MDLPSRVKLIGEFREIIQIHHGAYFVASSVKSRGQVDFMIMFVKKLDWGFLSILNIPRRRIVEIARQEESEGCRAFLLSSPDKSGGHKSWHGLIGEEP